MATNERDQQHPVLYALTRVSQLRPSPRLLLLLLLLLL
jgi:hypothetical protein